MHPWLFFMGWGIMTAEKEADIGHLPGKTLRQGRTVLPIRLDAACGPEETEEETMKKRLPVLILCFVMLLSVGSQGLADLKRGSSGDEVETIQNMLIELGFLDDVADGKFGKKTEAAVKKLQAYLGEKQTGKMDDLLIFKLYDLDSTATGMLAEDGLGEDELMEMYPASCSWEGKNEWGAVFCYRHLEEERISKQMSVLNPPEKLEKLLRSRLYEVWERDMLQMYDEWLDMVPEEQQAAVYLEKNAFEVTFREMKDGLEKDLWIESKGIDLCLKVHGEETESGEE